MRIEGVPEGIGCSEEWGIQWNEGLHDPTVETRDLLEHLREEKRGATMGCKRATLVRSTLRGIYTRTVIIGSTNLASILPGFKEIQPVSAYW
jgi:hypothetical protein